MAVDAELIEQIRHGNREAYGELFRKYYNQIYSLCLSILNNPQDAEEVTQEMFIHAYLKLDGLRKSDSFFPWLKKIARNRSRDIVRRERRQAARLELSHEYADITAPDEQVLRQELMDAIMEAIEALPVKDREVIQARIDGMNHREISERFDISVEVSMSRLYRARKRVADHLKGLYGVFGLTKILRSKVIMSGGTVAMKIGTGAKLTISIISVLIAGLVGFQIATRQPNQKTLTPTQEIQETPVILPIIAVTSQNKPDEKKTQIQTEKTGITRDSSGESVTGKEAEEFPGLRDQLENQNDSEETVDPEDKFFLHNFGMTRAEVEAKIPILEEEIRTEMSHIISASNDLMNVTQSQKDLDEQTFKWAAETDEEMKKAWRDLVDLKIHPYIGYRIRTGDEEGIRADLAEGGWLYEMQHLIPKVIRTVTVGQLGFGIGGDGEAGNRQ